MKNLYATCILLVNLYASLTHCKVEELEAHTRCPIIPKEACILLK